MHQVLPSCPLYMVITSERLSNSHQHSIPSTLHQFSSCLLMSGSVGLNPRVSGLVCPPSCLSHHTGETSGVLQALLTWLTVLLQPIIVIYHVIYSECGRNPSCASFCCPSFKKYSLLDIQSKAYRSGGCRSKHLSPFLHFMRTHAELIHRPI